MIGLYQFMPHDNRSFKEFLLVHSFWHKQWYALKGGYTTFPLATYSSSWLSLHNLEHLGIAGALKLSSGPDLVDVDLTKADQYSVWNELHIAEHIRINNALGIQT